MTRKPLPNRRRNETVQTAWRSGDYTHPFTVTVGLDDSGAPQEVFANHAKGDMAATLADACILISVALQYGIAPEALAKSLGQVPAWPAPQTAPASPIGTILAVVEDIAARVGQRA